MGRTHSLVGAASWMTISAACGWTPAIATAGAVVAAVAARGPDIDHPTSDTAMWCSPSYLTRRALRHHKRMRRVVASRPGSTPWLARLCGWGGHRRWTHTLLAAAVIGTVVGMAVCWWVGVAVTAGWSSAVIADMTTPMGCRGLWPVSVQHLAPAWARVTTGGLAEAVVVMGTARAVLAGSAAWVLGAPVAVVAGIAVLAGLPLRWRRSRRGSPAVHLVGEATRARVVRRWRRDPGRRGGRGSARRLRQPGPRRAV